MAGKSVMGGVVMPLPIVHLELVNPGPTMKFVFKMFKENGQNTPLLIPYIDNPSSIPVPGIVQLLKGDLGIAEKILSPLLQTTLPFFANPSVPVSGTNKPGSYSFGTNKNLNASQKNYIDSTAGTRVGFKSFEMTAIQGMMESLKPLMEIALILMELLAVIEDVICRNKATSIKIPVVGWIGFPSRKPKYTYGSLNYNLQHFRKALQNGVKAFNAGDTYPAIATSTPGGSAQPPDDQDPTGADPRDSIYLAYFDEDGNVITPPAWVLNSGKWGFSPAQADIVTTTGDNPEKTGFPLLSDTIMTGVNQLYKYHLTVINQTPALIVQSDAYAANLDSNTPPTYVNQSDILQALGTDFDPNKHINEINGQVNELQNNISDTVRQTILGEYINKHLNSQLKNRYIEKVSTGQIFQAKDLNSNTNPEDSNSINIVYPIFSSVVTLTGDTTSSTLSAEVYAVPKGGTAQQLTPYPNDFRIKNDNGSYVELRQKNDSKIYYEKITLVANFQTVDTIDAYFNTNANPASVPADKIIVPENTTKYKNNKIPGIVLSYYLPLVWEEVLVYQIQKNILTTDSAGNASKQTVVIGNETDTIQHIIEPELDYEIRLIQVINLPIISDGSINNLVAAFPKPNYLVVFREEFTQSSVIPIPVTSAGRIDRQPSTTVKPPQTKYLQISELTSDIPTIAYVAITVNADTTTDLKMYDPIDHTMLLRYINDNNLVVGNYYYLRYTNTEFGTESANNNNDNGEFYQIRSLKQNWIKETFTSNFDSRMNNITGVFPSPPVMIETTTNDTETILFDAPTQSIRIHKSKNVIPSYITDSTQPQLQFLSGTINIGIFFVYKIQTSGDYIIYNINSTLSSTLIKSEKIAANYYFTNVNSGVMLNWTPAVVAFQYLDSNQIDLQGNLSAYTGNIELYGVKQLSVIDDIFTKKGNTIFLDGVNTDQDYSNQTNPLQAIQKATSYLANLDKMIDGFYTVNGIKTITTEKGLSINVIDLDPNDLSIINNRTAYISNPAISWYRPFNITEAPSITDIEGNNNFPNYNSQTGTAFYEPTSVAPTFRIPAKYKGQNYEHIVPAINMGNDQGEGIVFQGLDPRYVSRTKWKVFWLVEAIKKDTAPIIFGEASIGAPSPLPTDVPTWQLPDPGPTPDTSPSGQEWYSLIHKLTALPYLISKLGVLLFGKLIPAIKKLIQLASNPTKITDLLLQIIKTKISKNMEFFDNSFTQNDFNQSVKSSQGSSKYFYTGKTTNPSMPSTASFILDGAGVAKFGASLGLNFPFGVKVSTLNQGNSNTKPTYNSNWFSAVTTDNRTAAEKDPTKFQTKRDQPIIKMILNIIKIPFEVIFLIAKWLICWVKKLTNPALLLSAVEELLSFKWLLCIISPMTLLKMVGASTKPAGCGCTSDDSSLGPDLVALLAAFDTDADNIGKNAAPQGAQALIDDLIKDIAGIGNNDLVEVLVYNIYKNGIYVSSEQDIIPYNPLSDSGTLNPSVPPLDANGNTNTPAGNAASAAANSPVPPSGCGPNTFDLSGLIAMPFVSSMPLLNKCQVIQVFLKPLQMILGLLTTIQEFLNAFIGMPTAIFGLEPTLSVPKIDVISSIQAKITKLTATLTQTTPMTPVK
jgi:hypothetical protein